jgi:hypothetical protein
VVVRAPKVQFYQINYATYPEGFPLDSFDPSSEAFRERLEKARRLLGSTGSDVTEWSVPGEAERRTLKVTRSLAPGAKSLLFQLKRGGRILGLRLGPASSFAGKERAIRLRISWDGSEEPAVDVPAGDFFGYAWGQPAARGLLLGTDSDTDYAYLPMPFDRSARVELVDDRKEGPPLEVRAEVLRCYGVEALRC